MDDEQFDELHHPGRRRSDTPGPRQAIRSTYREYPVIVIAIIATWIAIAVLLVAGALTIRHVSDQKVGLDTIQQERAESILRQCRDQNARRAATVIEYDKRALKQAHLPVPPGDDVNVIESAFTSEISKLPKRQQTEAIRGHDFTLALISTLAPRRNCLDVARQLAPSAVPAASGSSVSDG